MLSAVWAGEWGKITARGAPTGVAVLQEIPFEVNIHFATDSQLILSILVILASILVGLYLNSFFHAVTSWPFRLCSLSVAALMVFLPVATADMFIGGYTNNGVSEIGHDYIVFSWTNTVSTEGAVHYGTGSGMGSYHWDSDFSETHSIKVTGLTSSTKYYYELMACDVNGTEERISDKYFGTGDPKPWEVTTHDPPDTTAPNITDISIIMPTDSSAQFNWIRKQGCWHRGFYSSRLGVGTSDPDGCASK